MAEAIESMRAVTIASIHGHCVGGGVVLAAACDLRLAARSTRFSIPEVDLGIPLAWGGIPRLVREIGPAMTKELVLSCRPFTAEEGRALGFINRVLADDELDAACERLAGELARKSALTLTATKLAVNAATREMASTAGAWNDGDVLLSAFADPDSRRVGREYLERLAR
jgi:enoyl-CoA hydratase/carnithine racemase